MNSALFSITRISNQAVDNYWIRALPNLGNTTFINNINSAILRYSGAAAVDPVTPDVPSTNAMVETGLHPFVVTPVPGAPVQGGADVNLQLAITLDLTTFRFEINGASFVYVFLPVSLLFLTLTSVFCVALRQRRVNVSSFGRLPRC